MEWRLLYLIPCVWVPALPVNNSPIFRRLQSSLWLHFITWKSIMQTVPRLGPRCDHRACLPHKTQWVSTIKLWLPPWNSRHRKILPQVTVDFSTLLRDQWLYYPMTCWGPVFATRPRTTAWATLSHPCYSHVPLFYYHDPDLPRVTTRKALFPRCDRASFPGSRALNIKFFWIFGLVDVIWYIIEIKKFRWFAQEELHNVVNKPFSPNLFFSWKSVKQLPPHHCVFTPLNPFDSYITHVWTTHVKWGDVTLELIFMTICYRTESLSRTTVPLFLWIAFTWQCG